MKKILLIFTTIALFNSCGIYSKYKRPNDIVSDNLMGDVATNSEDTIPSWRNFFTDPQLQTLIDLALNQNTDLRKAQLQMTEAKAALSSARLSFLPSFALSPNGSMSSFDGSTPSKTYNLVATAQWQLDLFGGLRNAKLQAKTAYEQAGLYKQAVQTQIISAVASYYYSLQMLDEQLKIAESTDTLWSNYVSTMELLKEAGNATEASVAQAKANYFTVKTNIADLKQSIIETENAFNTLLAEPIGSIRFVRQSSQPSFSIPESVPLESLYVRPDVRMAETSLKSFFYATNAARSAFYPSISLSGTAGWTNNAGSMIINPGKFLWSAVASLVQPLFQNGKLMAQLKITKAQQEEAQLTFQQTLLDAGKEVNNALSQWQTAKLKTQLYSSQAEAASSALNSTKLLMEYGTTNYLEVLTAQQSLFSAQLAVIANRFAETSSAINLYTALGGGQN